MADYQPDVVMYHSPCSDGVTAAAVVNRYYGGKTIEFIEGRYDNTSNAEKLIEQLRGKHVLLVDFSFKPDIIQKVSQAVESLLILDHHDSAQKALAEYVSDDHDEDNTTVDNVGEVLAEQKVFAIFAKDDCGTSLAWKFFFHDEEMPLFIEYVKAVDLGRPESMEFGRQFMWWSRGQRLSITDHTDYLNQYKTVDDLRPCFTAGNAIETYMGARFQTLWAEVQFADLNGLKIPYLFTDYGMCSEMSMFMLRQDDGYQVAITFYMTKNGLGASIRSVEGFDSTVIAKQFGGGGHKQACGFNIPSADIGDFVAGLVDGHVVPEERYYNDEL